MMGELDSQQIDEVLRSEILGRIGCVANGWPYVVPVTYVYDGESVYAHTGEGMKLRAMRACPQVCLEVEQIRSMANWRTVLVRGYFEELLSDRQERAMGLIARRIANIETSASARLTQEGDLRRREGFRRPILFRVRIESRTGRYELV
jgi:nitroimidazol reductase NimA-like FMN-containing flavoprotein (pyridoxamine 5'-phosphate oxidase superfamily)